MAGGAEAHGIGLVDYVYGVLPEDEAADARAHLAKCACCHEEAEALRRVVSLLDALEGDRRQMHFVELDQEGGVTLYAAATHFNQADHALETWEFQSDSPPDHFYHDGEEMPVVATSNAKYGGRNYVATLRRPVPPGGRISLLLLYSRRPEWAAQALGDGQFRFSWKQGPSSTDEFAYLQAVRLPAGAHLLRADPRPDETRTAAAITLIWRRVLPPMQFFECTVEYRMDRTR